MSQHHPKRKTSGGKYGNDKRKRPATVACYDCHEQVRDLKAHRKVCTKSFGPTVTGSKAHGKKAKISVVNGVVSGTQHERTGSRGVDVRMDIWTELLESVPENVPHCAHGPMLLFERYFEGGGGSRLFWACAAHRDRKAKSSDPKSAGRSVKPSDLEKGTANTVSVDAYKGNIVCRAFCYDDSKRVSTAESIHQPWREYGNDGIPGLKESCSVTNTTAQTKSTTDRLRLGAAGQLEKATGFCRSCQTFVTVETQSDHMGEAHAWLEKSKWHFPTQLLAPAAADKSNAQYFFSDSTIQTVLQVLSDQKCHRVLCVGAPSIHEALLDAADKSRSVVSDAGNHTEPATLATYLLDIDNRFSWFYSQNQFCRYNMGNHSFWVTGKSQAQAFLSEGCDAVVIDPPFGIPLEAFAWTVRRIWKDLGYTCEKERQGLTKSSGHQSKPPATLIFFPYFQERQLLSVLPEGFTMSDYSVNYTNHPVYTDVTVHGDDGSTATKADGAAKSRPSAVRIFTNVDPKHFVLPLSEGYTLCEPCQRYTSRLNQHCESCGICPSKDGRTYTHCDACGTCVKPGRRHCDTCKRCEVRGHLCTNAAAATKPTGVISFDEDSAPTGSEQAGSNGDREATLGMCHICGSAAHRRQVCPERRTTSERATLHLRIPHPRTTTAPDGDTPTPTHTTAAVAAGTTCGAVTSATPSHTTAFATTTAWIVSSTT
eukprot:m.106482 g.106482  ORF g.106482 m.106482 type:complete len:709 (+) comp16901_c0_seq4:110-2236(+)